MPGLEDLARRGAVLVLAELAKRAPITMQEFEKASGLTFDAAARLREDLRLLGLITVVEAEARGRMKRFDISPTNVGRRVGECMLSADAILREKRK